VSENFYRQLKSFTSFEAFSDTSFYSPAPADWYVVITDVQGSTKAIEAGRYQDVNTIGVAAITALQNILPSSDFPFVFGGDGMSALLPPDVLEAAKEELSALRLLSESKYNLNLRVGIVQHSILEAQGSPVLVAKHQMQNGQHLAMFSGGGLSLAEDLIKGDIQKYGVPVMNKTSVNLERLSCRWQPIPSTNGVMLSILVQALDNTDLPPVQRYEAFSSELNSILGSIQKHNPVNYANMRQKSVLTNLKNTNILHAGNWRSLLISLYFSFIYLLPWKRNSDWVRDFGESLHQHSDYWKFDDMLRMVLDCTPEQHRAIEQLCIDWQQNGWIVYGIHTSDSALMTCQFDAFADGKHMHFIDGGDGGYAMAAKGLKLQLKSLNAV